MSLVNFKAQNHPQQTGKRGARPEVDNLETPWDFFTPLHDRFGFTLDACALPHNAKCKRYYVPPQLHPHDPVCIGALGRDGLKQSWAGERVWCNPPYSDIEPWVLKAHEQTEVAYPAGLDDAQLVVMLLPANRTEQGWWQRWVEPARLANSIRVEFLPGRLRFIKHGHDRVEPNQRPPFGCCLLIWGAA